MEHFIPNFFVENIEQSELYYKKIGFETIQAVPENKPYNWLMMQKENATIMFQTLESVANELPQVKNKIGGAVLFYIQVKEIRFFFEEIKNVVTVVKPLHKTFYGATEFMIEDLNGYLLSFAQDE
jgi:uncharacterized glyoxalase superfamily protein PhnB